MYMTHWGYHLILNARKCVPDTIRSREIIDVYTRFLVRSIDMVPYGKPRIVMFGTGNKKGYTMVQLIETSNICAHFVEETNDMYLDVFSCKEFDPETVKSITRSAFRPEFVDTRLIYRDANIQMK